MPSFSFSPERIRKIVDEFKSSEIMVVGDVMLDEYMWGDVKRISPEAPVPVVEIESVTKRLGGAANVVQNLRKLDLAPVLISLCGRDENGRKLCGMLESSGCSSEGLVQSPKRPTTIKTRVMARHQQIVRADRETTTDLDSQEHDALWSRFEEKLDSVKGVIVSDYGKGVISEPFIGHLIEACTRKGKFVAIDPKERHFDLYRGVSVITPNLKEAHAMLGLPYGSCSDQQVEKIGWELMERLSLPYLLITLSERGMGLFEKDSKSYTNLPTAARKVFDVTGAGDTVISVFSAASVCGATPLEAAFLANHAAGLTVAELGTASVNAASLLNDCGCQCQTDNSGTCSSGMATEGLKYPGTRPPCFNA
ncbi:MAG: D-glycero-beta-D-manno-heptose-7-phosphate kinase [Chitinispirillaceae bacterium]